jgi:hypothetical protein
MNIGVKTKPVEPSLINDAIKLNATEKEKRRITFRPQTS